MNRSAPVKLRNVGNSCYLNVIMQLLFCCDDFNQTFAKYNLRPFLLGKTHSLAKLYQLLYINWCHKQDALFKQLLHRLNQQVLVGGQQDAQETLTQFLNRLHNELLEKTTTQWFEGLSKYCPGKREWVLQSLNDLYLRDYSIVSKYFSGLMLNHMQCSSCRHTSQKIEKFRELILPVVSPKTKKACTNMNETLNAFFEDNYVQWFCPRCNKNSKSVKHTILLKLPPFLVIVFNRFQANGHKISNVIDCGEDLNLARYMPRNFPSQETLYSLRAVIKHQGNARGGHYVACVNYDNQWYHCSDDVINPIKHAKDTNTKTNSYILLYGLKFQ